MKAYYSRIILIAVIIFCFFFNSCTCSEISARELLSVIESSQSEVLPSSRNIYEYSASVHSRNHMSDDLISALYYSGEKSDMWEFSLLCDYAVRLSDDDCQFEVHIFKVRYLSDVDTVEKFLQRRLERLRSRALYIYDPENYERYAFSSGVYVKENFVMLLCLPDNESALRAVESVV